MQNTELTGEESGQNPQFTPKCSQDVSDLGTVFKNFS